MIKDGVLTVKKITIDTLIMVMVLITPFLRYYEVPALGISFETAIAFLLLFATGLLAMVRARDDAAAEEVRLSKKWYGLFLAWMVAVTAAYELFTDINVNAAAANYNFNSLLMPLLRALTIFFLLSGKIKTDSGIGIYAFLVNTVIGVYIVQWILMLCGARISFKLPFDYDVSWEFMGSKIFGMNSYPTALFSEKSHLCEYVCPYIAMCLYSKNLVQKNRIKKAVLYSVCVVSTASGNGIVIVALIWLMYFALFGEFKKRHHRFFVIIGGVVMLIGAFYVLKQVPRFSDMFDRLFVDNSGSAFENTKADYRVYRGLDIFSKLPFWAQLVGVGYPHMFLFAQEYGIVSQFDYSWKLYEYFSAVSMVLLYSGGVGAFFCFKHFYALYKFKSKAVKGLIVITAALWFSTEMLFRTTHIMYILLIIAVLIREHAAQKQLEEQ